MKKPSKPKGLDIDALKKKYGKDPIKSPAKTVRKVVKAKPKKK